MQTISQIVDDVMSATDEKYLTSDEVAVMLRAAVIAARRNMFEVSRELQEKFFTASDTLHVVNNGFSEELGGFTADQVDSARKQYEDVVELIVEGMDL